MILIHLCNYLTVAMLSAAAVSADPPRRSRGPDVDRQPMRDGPPGRPHPPLERVGSGGGDRRGADVPPDESDDGPPFQWRRMPEAERQKLKHFIEEHFPRLALEMEGLRERAAQRFERRMMRIGPEMRRLMETMERDPQRGLMMIRERQVAIQLRQLVMEYHDSSDDARRAELRGKIKDAVSQEFKIRMERRRAEVRQMETKLAELRGRLAEMDSLCEDIIARRVRELLEKPPPFPRPDRPDGPDGFDRPDDPPDPRPEPGPSEPEP